MISIEEPVETKDSFNSTVVTWKPVKQVWAAIDPIRGGERFTAEQIKAEVDTKITIRTTSGITPKHRLVYGGRIFDIKAIVDIGTLGRTMELMCKEAA